MIQTLIFDIGKTNKKVFLFDQDLKETLIEVTRFEEILDEDGFPCDDLKAIETWILGIIEKVVKNDSYNVVAINFSTYGASFIHIDGNGKSLTPLYNYLKPIDDNFFINFDNQHGSQQHISEQTASPWMVMLNSGLQLYWLKYSKPEVYKKIKWSLHLPQYFSYFLTGIAVSEYTSIGCHTMLWDFSKKDYHDWVFQEGLDKILPPIINTNISVNLFGKELKIGSGIHDSSAALIPYLKTNENPFLLISTGTWSIALNPFNMELLTNEDLDNDCLNFLQIDGSPVKAARLFLGYEYEIQFLKIQLHFKHGKDTYKNISFNKEIYNQIKEDKKYYFHFENLKTPWPLPANNQFQVLNNFTIAYHQLMFELVDLQIIVANRAIGKVPIQKIYIDGGFASNTIFIEMLQAYYFPIEIVASESPFGSALGAAHLLGILML